MTNIYSMKINSPPDRNIVNLLLPLVSEQKREKVNRFVFQQDSLRSLFGDLISRYALCKKTGLKNSHLKFGVNAYNKPILMEPDCLHFNVSHAGSWVVCAVADILVGIDVEQIKPINFDIAKRFFTKEEYSYLIKQPAENRLKYFYTLWTLKESYIKADGRGLSLPLNSFSMNIIDDNISVITSNTLNSCYFKKYDIDDSHICSVCSLDNGFQSEFSEVSVEELLQTLR